MFCTKWIAGAPLAVVIALALLPARVGEAAVVPLETGGFKVDQTITVPGEPGRIYDLMTGDISGWWDHTFSGHPKRLFIDPRPGGGFYEIFDDTGDGVLHGTVTWAQRGKRLRFHGPLGLSGNAIDLVVTWDYEKAGDSTRVHCVCNAAGQIEKGWAETVDGVWHHFLVEGFKAWVESGKVPTAR